MVFTGISYMMLATLALLGWWKLGEMDEFLWLLGFGAVFACTSCITFTRSLRLRGVSSLLLILFATLVFLWSKSFSDLSVNVIFLLDSVTDSERRAQELGALLACTGWCLVLVVHDFLYPKGIYAWLGECGEY